jgi:hypothetical protein
MDPSMPPITLLTSPNNPMELLTPLATEPRPMEVTWMLLMRTSPLLTRVGGFPITRGIRWFLVSETNTRGIFSTTTTLRLMPTIQRSTLMVLLGKLATHLATASATNKW